MPHTPYHRATAILALARTDSEVGQAAALYRVAIALDPADARALYLLGDALRRMEKTGGGEARRRAFLTNPAALPNANLDMGEAIGGSDPSRALTTLFQAQAQLPASSPDPAATRIRGLILALSDRAGAVHDPVLCRRMILFLDEQLIPDLPPPDPADITAAWTAGLSPDAEGWAAEGHACYHQGRFTAALDAFHRAAADAPEWPACHRWAADTLYRLDKPTAAAAVATRAAALDPGDAKGWRSLGHALFAAEDPAGAARAFRRTLILDPDDTEAWRSIGHALFVTGNPAGAAHAFCRLVAWDPRDAEGWRGIGHALLAAGDPAGAGHTFRRAATWDPGDTEAWRGVGHALLTADDPAGAVPAFLLAVILDPDDTEAWLGAGHALFAAGNVPQAARVFRQAVALRPDDGAARRYRADSLFQMGFPGAAHTAHCRALALDPADAMAWASCGHAAPTPGMAAVAFDRARRLGLATVDAVWVWSRFLAAAQAVRTLAPRNKAV